MGASQVVRILRLDAIETTKNISRAYEEHVTNLDMFSLLPKDGLLPGLIPGHWIVVEQPNCDISEVCFEPMAKISDQFLE